MESGRVFGIASGLCMAFLHRLVRARLSGRSFDRAGVGCYKTKQKLNTLWGKKIGLNGIVLIPIARTGEHMRTLIQSSVQPAIRDTRSH